VAIRPVTSPQELARAFELIGARRATTLEQDRYFLQVARRFPDDRPLMLVAELDGQIIGAGFAFRRCSQPGGAVTLRNVAILPPHDGIGPQQRLIRAIELAAVRLGADGVVLGGPTGAEREFYLSMGYRGRRDGGLMRKALPRPARPRRPPSAPGPPATLTGSRTGGAVSAACRLWRHVRFMFAAGSDGFVAWLLAAIGGAMDAERVGPDAAGSVRVELAKFPVRAASRWCGPAGTAAGSMRCWPVRLAGGGRWSRAWMARTG
jgi:predicted N-acetyltransferase YhbS